MKYMKSKITISIGIIVALIVGFCGGYVIHPPATPVDPIPTGFENIRIRFFVGGDPGDAFASIVQKGAMEAEAVMGCKVEYVYSGWDPERMVTQFKDAIAAKPDAISVMGHPGQDALEHLIEQAIDEGIYVQIVNVDLAKLREKWSDLGYTGEASRIVDGEVWGSYEAGYALGSHAVKFLDLKPGDKAFVQGLWGRPGFKREIGIVDALEDAGLVVDTIECLETWLTDPTLMFPTYVGYLADNPDVKLLAMAGGQTLMAVPTLMETLGKEPGEIFCIGMDLNPGVIEAFESGYVQCAQDQQPYFQGFMPIVNLCLRAKYHLTGLFMNTSTVPVDSSNYMYIKDLVLQGYR